MRYKNLALYVLIGVMAFSIGIFLTGCATTDGGGGGGSQTEPTPYGRIPTVSNTNPANAAINVPINSGINATFSKEMNSATITRTTFTLENTTLGGTSVIGTVDYADITAIFMPLVNLAPDTLYTATITTLTEDLEGNPLASNYVWSFTTSASADIDTTAPTVIRTNPVDDAINVVINKKLNVTFSEAMNPTTITRTTFTLENTTLGGTSVTGTVTYAGITATFTPLADFNVSTLYTATITTGSEDIAGNALASNYVWSFTTSASADIDTTAPTVILTDPVDNAIDVPVNSTIEVTFSEEMTPTTVTTATFTLENATLGGISVTGAVVYVGTTAIFTPLVDLDVSTLYTATVTTEAADLSDNALASDYVWNFTTGSGVAAGPARVILGTARNFVILAKTAVSTVPDSVITGDVGVSPAATTFLTGFSYTMVGTTSATSTQVTGNLYGADMTTPTNENLTTAVSDMETAYTDAATRPAPPDFLNVGAGEIGGQTLTPGLYTWTTGVTISTDVTISGGSNDIWIFQIPGNLTMSADKLVNLGGTAKAKNIFWQVAGAVTIGTNAHFEGIILTQTSIDLQTGSSMNGRALAQTRIDLDQSTVTQPAP